MIKQFPLTVDMFLRFFGEIEKINYQKKIIVFDEEYTKDELDKIHDLLKNKWQVNKLYRLDTIGLHAYDYDHSHDLIQRKIILVENCDLDIITDAYELFEYTKESYELWYVVSQLTQDKWDKEEEQNEKDSNII